MNNSKFRVTSVLAALFALGLFVQACGAAGANQQPASNSPVVSNSLHNAESRRRAVGGGRRSLAAFRAGASRCRVPVRIGHCRLRRAVHR